MFLEATAQIHYSAKKITYLNVTVMEHNKLPGTGHQSMAHTGPPTLNVTSP